jgi:alpha-glucosidase
MGFTGSDIGGLQNNLQVIYARWIQLGFFILLSDTLFRDHGDQEPWAFDEDIIDITRKFVNLSVVTIFIYHVLAIY